MWESLDRFTAEELNMDIVEVGAKRSRKHLNVVASRLVEQGLPKSLAVCMFSKGSRITGAFLENTCSTCGLHMLHRNSFTLRQHFAKGERIIKAECCGCGAKTTCGKLPAMDLDVNRDEASETIAPTLCAKNTSKVTTMNSPLHNTPKIASLQNSSKAKKRRGSALQRLLQEDESESDRSLSGFLNQFASQ